jgi:bacterioferritin
MKGDQRIVELLNEILTAELTAINQYFIHAEICEHRGYDSLSKVFKSESIDEMKHAETLIERVLYLEGQPNMSRYSEIKVGSKPEDMLRNDLALEQGAVERLNRGIALCVQIGDNGSREVLEGILRDEERHVDFIETQLALIDQVGIANYLSQQIGAED